MLLVELGFWHEVLLAEETIEEEQISGNTSSLKVKA